MQTSFLRFCAMLSLLTLLVAPLSAITIITPMFATPVPDMGSTLALMGIALLGLGIAGRRKKLPKN